MFQHKQSKSHSLRMTYKHIIVNEKIKCLVCDAEVGYRSYEQHLDSKNHFNLPNNNLIALSTSPIKCWCGLTIQERNYAKHLQSKFHLNKIQKQIDDFENLKRVYAYRVNKCSCCVKCLAADLTDKYYDHEWKLCLDCAKTNKPPQDE